MTSGRYQLRSGRLVWLCGLHIQPTYRGQHEGTPETASLFILDGMVAAVRRAMPPGEPLMVIKPDVMPLPKFRIIAELESRTGVVKAAPQTKLFESDEIDLPSDPDIQSRLFACWFSDNLDVTVGSLVESAIHDIDWDANAADYDIMDF